MFQKHEEQINIRGQKSFDLIPPVDGTQEPRDRSGLSKGSYGRVEGDDVGAQLPAIHAEQMQGCRPGVAGAGTDDLTMSHHEKKHHHITQKLTALAVNTIMRPHAPSNGRASLTESKRNSQDYRSHGHRGSGGFAEDPKVRP